MTLYGMLDYGQGFDPLLRVKIAPVFLSVYPISISRSCCCTMSQIASHMHIPMMNYLIASYHISISRSGCCTMPCLIHDGLLAAQEGPQLLLAKVKNAARQDWYIYHLIWHRHLDIFHFHYLVYLTHKGQRSNFWRSEVMVGKVCEKSLTFDL